MLFSFQTMYTGYSGGWWRRGLWSENNVNPRGILSSAKTLVDRVRHYLQLGGQECAETMVMCAGYTLVCSVHVNNNNKNTFLAETSSFRTCYDYISNPLQLTMRVSSTKKLMLTN